MTLPPDTRANLPNQFPTEFAIPTRRITPADIAADFGEHGPFVEVDIAAPGERVHIAPGYNVAPENQSGEAFVYFGRTMSRLHGSYMNPGDLFEFMSPEGMNGATARFALLGDAVSNDTPLVTLVSPDGLVRIHYYAGSTSIPARTLSRIGDAGVFGNEERREYQHAVSELFYPIAVRTRSTTSKALNVNQGEHMVHDIEDCAATCLTLAGVGMVTERVTKNPHVRRIDVVVGTGQALTALALEAIRRRQPTEINVGFGAWGLSEGIGPNLDHKNYITHAPLAELQKAYNTIFVVGDMGEAGGDIADVPWRKNRRDTAGSTLNGDGSFAERLGSARSLRLAYARGGHFMVGLYDYTRDNMGLFDRSAMIMAVAKRLDGPKGFALRLDQLRTPLASHFQEAP